MKELQTIVDDTRTYPAIDPTAFPNTPSEGFWSASPYAGATSYAWLIAFDIGSTGGNLMGNTYWVRCVR